MVDISPEPFDSPVALALTAEVQLEYVARYGGEDVTVLRVEEFAPPRGLFLVVRLDGVPVACGGWRRGDGSGGAGGSGVDADDAEIKRMYVQPGVRGVGLARRLLAGIEDSARTAGCRRAVLETGDRQPEAVALYESSGYTPIPGFGVYRCHPSSRCYGKVLGAATEADATG